MEDRLLNIIVAWVREHPGRALGTLIGFATGLSLIFLGVWKTLVIALATWLGYPIGKWTDDEGTGIREYLDERLRGSRNFI